MSLPVSAEYFAPCSRLGSSCWKKIGRRLQGWGYGIDRQTDRQTGERADRTEEKEAGSCLRVPIPSSPGTSASQQCRDVDVEQASPALS